MLERGMRSMSVLQERAYEMIKHLPDDKVYYIVQLLEGLEGLTVLADNGEISPEQVAYDNLQKIRKCSDIEIDYKKELALAREEKYAGVN